MKTVGEVASCLQGADTFRNLDAKGCFSQLKLDEESSLQCTFKTPLGCYRFTILPQKSSKERWTIWLKTCTVLSS